MTVIETALCFPDMHARISELHLHCFLLINRGSVQLGSPFFIFFSEAHYFNFFVRLFVYVGAKELHMLRGSDATEIFMLPGVGVW